MNTPPPVREQAERLGLRFFVRAAEAVGHANHWYVVREARYHANLAELTAGFDPVLVQITTADPRVSQQNLHLNMPANREVMAGLADHIAQRFAARR